MESIQANISQALTNFPQVKLGYLFGSVAKDKANKLSDVDIAVLVDGQLGPMERLELRLQLMAACQRALQRDDVDVVLLNEASPLLSHQVLKYGKLLYCPDDRVRYRFTYESNREYLDTEHLRQVQWQYLYRRIKEGRFGVGRTDYSESLAKARRLFAQAT